MEKAKTHSAYVGHLGHEIHTCAQLIAGPPCQPISNHPVARRSGVYTLATVSPKDHDYLAREARARVEIDKQLVEAGWQVQSQNAIKLDARPGVAVREFALEKGHGRVDYLLFLNGQPVGVIEAKPEGTTLVEVERQSGKYVQGLPGWMQPPVYPLPFIYESIWWSKPRAAIATRISLTALKPHAIYS